jgi:hypothetical protein
MFSFFQIMTLDSWCVSFARPLMDGQRWFSAIVVVCLMVAGNIAYGNILIGCFVDKAIQIAGEEAERNKSLNDNQELQIREDILRSFRRNFEHNKMTIDQCEHFLNNNPDLRLKFDALDITDEDIRYMWRIMDTEGLDMIAYNEFKLALERIHGLARSRDLIHIHSLMTRLELRTDSVTDGLSTIRNSTTKTLEFLGKLADELDATILHDNIQMNRWRPC